MNRDMAPRIALALVLAILSACTQPTSDMATDHCALTEYRQECDLSVGHEDNASPSTPQDLKACYAKAEKEALRILAGVDAECRIPGAEAREW